MASGACEDGTIRVDEQELPRTTAFKYLGSTIAANSDLDMEVTSRVNATWLKWRLATGVLCDKNVKAHIKAKLYKIVVRPVAPYGAECWPTTKRAKRRLAMMETRILRRFAGVTLSDRVRNDDIRERFDAAPIVDKMREARLCWLGHVLRADNATVARRAYDFDVEGRRSRGRPKQRWTNTIRRDLVRTRLHPSDAADRDK